jgi:hypothetical protein
MALGLPISRVVRAGGWPSSSAPQSFVVRHPGLATAVATLVIWSSGAWHTVSRRALPPASSAATAATTTPAPLRVCADPNHLPFSNLRGEGFENAIAQLLAGELRRPLAYQWQTQDDGFLRTTLHAHVCDVVMSVPSSLDHVLVTRPYYRSSVAVASDVSAAVRRDDAALHDALDAAMARRKADIERILRQFGVPLLPGDVLNGPPSGRAGV